MSQKTNQKIDRLFSIDLLKAISITAVVSYHSVFVPESTYPLALYWMDILFAPLRFCVPVFFTISFLLLERSFEKNSTAFLYPLLKKRFTRLLIPTLFWGSLAVALRLLGKANQTESILILILRGKIFPGYYYLLVMLQFLPVFIILNRQIGRVKNFLIILILQLIVLIVIYMSNLGAFGADITLFLRSVARPFFAYWFVYMSLGACFYKNWLKLVKISHQISLLFKIILLSSTSLIMVAEYNYLQTVTDGNITPFEYAMFSCILSAIVMFLCFSSIEEDQIPLYVRIIIKLLSKYSLGIFCINGIFSMIFLQLGTQLFVGLNFTFAEILAIKLISCNLLLIVSLGFSMLCDRVGLGACVR
ncbi:acyltransferase [Nostoc sp. C052]|uniref:acyltransferase family protein n=1 Tax=Nostoc sp. C052 TaxID=2576902 RepID=UPI0015C40244|nr:acyltransferase [Nostoc sp. C052]QLE43840.1 acyltransferase [Nostoc sp. C052]